MMITTRDLKAPKVRTPEKLNHITTAIVPNAEPQPEPKGTDLSKMITTHDEPKAAPVEDKVEVKVGEPIDVAPPAPVEIEMTIEQGTLPEASDKVKEIVARVNGDTPAPVHAPKPKQHKGGRPKKATKV